MTCVMEWAGGGALAKAAAYNQQPMAAPLAQTLRSCRWFTRLVLAWFVLTLGAAVASPMVRPQALELICSGAGAFKLVVKADEGALQVPGHTLDCPLCASVGAPPPAARALESGVRPAAHAVRPFPAAPFAVRAAAPLPPRGPPRAV